MIERYKFIEQIYYITNTCRYTIQKIKITLRKILAGTQCGFRSGISRVNAEFGLKTHNRKRRI